MPEAENSNYGDKYLDHGFQPDVARRIREIVNEELKKASKKASEKH